MLRFHWKVRSLYILVSNIGYLCVQFEVIRVIVEPIKIKMHSEIMEPSEPFPAKCFKVWKNHKIMSIHYRSSCSLMSISFFMCTLSQLSESSTQSLCQKGKVRKLDLNHTCVGYFSKFEKLVFYTNVPKCCPKIRDEILSRIIEIFIKFMKSVTIITTL